MYITIRRLDPDPEVAASILADLPTGLVLPREPEVYLEAARHMVTYHALAEDGEPVGLLLLEPHFTESIEIFLMAVRASHLRQGIGRRLLAAAEADARAFAVRLIEIKTLGPSDSEPGSASSRAFYADMGFLPVEEIHGLWEGKPALIMMKVL